jgi:hypothetical protein
LPEFDDAFDRELVEWFALRKGVWSGTAAELLAAVRSRPDAGSVAWSQSARMLYSHLESRRHILRSSGVDVRLQEGSPRMLSLRPCPVGKSAKKPPATASAVHKASTPPANAVQPAEAKNAASVAAEETKSAAARPDSAARFVSGRFAERDSPGGRVFDNTGEALSAVAEMRDLIREQNLDPRAAIELMANRAQEITGCCGTTVGLFKQNTVVYPVRTGIGATMAGLELHSNFFQSCVRTGGALQLRDARRHPRLGAMCQQEGVGSLIIVPIFHNREVIGAMEFFYRETRSFSTGQVMDLELIAGVVSERLSAAAEVELKQEAEVESKQEEERDGPAQTRNNEDSPTPQTSDATESARMDSLSSRLAAAPRRLGRALKSVWTPRAQADPVTEEPVVKENVTTTSTLPESEVEATEPAQTEPESTVPSTELED